MKKGVDVIIPNRIGFTSNHSRNNERTNKRRSGIAESSFARRRDVATTNNYVIILGATFIVASS